MADLKSKPKKYWKNKLTPEQYRILRQRGTEPPFSGHLLHNKDSGVYRCAACGTPLFGSGEKYDSQSGWPSFYDVLSEGTVELKEDNSHGLSPVRERPAEGTPAWPVDRASAASGHLFSNGVSRTEAVCASCGSHLGHVFDDGPKPTGKRYCINSLALDFDPKTAKS